MNRSMTTRLFSAGAAGVIAFFSCTANLQGQDFVVRDRVSEARERIVEKHSEEMTSPLVVSVHADNLVVGPQLTEQTHGLPGAYVSTAPTPGFEENDPPAYVEEDYGSSVTHSIEGKPYYESDPGQSRVQLSSASSGPADAWTSQYTPGVVLTNAHYFDGMKGPGNPLPFAYFSAYARSGRGQEHDAAGNPIFCDEWGRWSCQCDCCNEPLGLDCLRPKGHAKKRSGQCGKAGCKGNSIFGKFGSGGCGCGN